MANGGAPRVIYAKHSTVEMVMPGYPDQFRNQQSDDVEVRPWAIHLAFNVTPRYAGELRRIGFGSFV